MRRCIQLFGEFLQVRLALLTRKRRGRHRCGLLSGSRRHRSRRLDPLRHIIRRRGILKIFLRGVFGSAFLRVLGILFVVVAAGCLVAIGHDDDAVRDPRTVDGGEQQCGVGAEVNPVDGDEDGRTKEAQLVFVGLQGVVLRDRGQQQGLGDPFHQKHAAAE